MSTNDILELDLDSIRDLIPSQLKETGVPSLALAVAQGDRIIWEEAFGLAHRESGSQATPDTLYSLASISKPITATGLMVLVERGLIDLDRPANDYLGDGKLKAWIGRAEDATVRRLANHTSGLPTHYHFFFEDEPYSSPPMDETIRRYGNLVNPPGETYRYANLGYGILDHIIARVSGQTFAKFIHEEVFAPLGMARSSIGLPQNLAPHHATRYTNEGSPIPFYDFDHPGASAAFCSAHDLVSFGIFHLKSMLPIQKSILSDSAIDQMQSPSDEVKLKSVYGIGWFTYRNTGGCRIVEHGGNMAGVSTCLYLAPEHNLTIAVLTNGNNKLHSRIADKILTALPDYQPQPSSSERPKPEFDPSPDITGKWSGSIQTYNGPVPLSLDFQSRTDIRATLGNQPDSIVTDPTFSSLTFTGSTTGDIGTEDAAKLPYKLDMSLSHRGNLLNGSVTAISLPHPRFGNALSHWVELEQQP